MTTHSVLKTGPIEFLSDEQNEAVSKELFDLAHPEINKSVKARADSSEHFIQHLESNMPNSPLGMTSIFLKLVIFLFGVVFLGGELVVRLIKGTYTDAMNDQAMIASVCLVISIVCYRIILGKKYNNKIS